VSTSPTCLSFVVLSTESSCPSSSSLASSSITTPHLSLYSKWHNTLGHPSLNVLNHVLQFCNMSSINKTSMDFCVPCCMGKSHQFPTSPSSNLYTHHLQLIFCDLWGHLMSLHPWVIVIVTMYHLLILIVAIPGFIVSKINMTPYTSSYNFNPTLNCSSTRKSKKCKLIGEVNFVPSFTISNP